MKKTKKFLFQLSFYDQRAIQNKLADLARQGWMLKQPGQYFWTFERMEPRELRFAVTYFPGASEFDPGPTVGELTKMDFCARLAVCSQTGRAAGVLQRRPGCRPH